MKAGRAFLWGVIAAALMTLVLAILRLLGIPANLAMMLGTMVGLAPGAVAWTVGFIVHLAAGGVFGLLYAALFEGVLRAAGAGRGALIGLVHGVLSGLFLGLIPALHPQVPEILPAPGVFLLGLGWVAAVVFVLLHVIFGAIVGAAYGPTRRHLVEAWGHTHAHGDEKHAA